MTKYLASKRDTPSRHSEVKALDRTFMEWICDTIAYYSADFRKGSVGSDRRVGS